MKKNYQHPVLESFTQNEREEIWHAFREKKPNWSWSLSFFGLWAGWLTFWMIAAQQVGQNFVEGIGARVEVHFILTLVIGVIGGVMLIGRAMLPNRMKEFHQFLDGKDRISVLRELDVQHIDTEQTAA